MTPRFLPECIPAEELNLGSLPLARFPEWGCATTAPQGDPFSALSMIYWSGYQGLNLGSLAPEASALPLGYILVLVGHVRFELTTPRSQTECATPALVSGGASAGYRSQSAPSSRTHAAYKATRAASHLGSKIKKPWRFVLAGLQVVPGCLRGLRLSAPDQAMQ